MSLPPDSTLLLRLRAARREELAQTLPASLPDGLGADEHRVSLTRVHDDVSTVLVRIDAAEAAMRPVLRAWAQDPARGGAHLLPPEGDAAGLAHGVPPTATSPWPTLELEEQLPDTLRPGHEGTP